MNKGITLLILLAVLGAMGLVLYSHTRDSSGPQPVASVPAVSRENPVSSYQSNAQRNSASPLQDPQGDTVGLRQFEPPLSGSTEGAAARQGNDGAPRSVTLTTPMDGRPARPPAASVDSPVEPPAPAVSRQTAAIAPPATVSTPAMPQSAPASAQTVSSAPVPATPASTATTDPPVKPQAAESKPVPAASQTAAAAQQSNPGTVRQSAPQTQTAQTQAAQLQTSQASTTPTPAGKPGGSPGLMAGPTPWDTPQTVPQTGAQNGTQATPPSAPETPAAPGREAKAPTRQELSDKGTHALRNISLSSSGAAMQLRIEADGPFPYKSFALTGPDRLVVDLPGTWKGMKAPSVPGNDIVKNVRLGQQTAGPRLVLDLSGGLKTHSVERAGNVITVTVQ